MTATQPQITNSCFFLKARLDLTPDITYAMSDYVKKFGSKSGMRMGMDYSVGLRAVSDVEMTCGKGATASISTDEGRHETKLAW